MAKKLFSDADFDKSISIVDQLVFDKPDLKTLRLDLTWAGTDLDICAFLLGEDGMIHDRADLVYFNSQLALLSAHGMTCQTMKNVVKLCMYFLKKLTLASMQL